MRETFYGRFYGLDTPPFHITPDASLLFSTETHQQALATIEYGIASGKGFIVVTGEVGVGKTTVLKMCLDKLESSTLKIIYIFNPAIDVRELYETLLDELEVETASSGRRPVNLLHQLQRALLAAHKKGVHVILAVDEAQNMPEATLEALRILSNFETAKAKLLQIILAGQPELEAMLARHSLRQLAQRIAVRSRIEPLSRAQSRAYIVHRIQCAGRPGDRPLFTTAALRYLAFVARGIPRTLNIVCDNALINGYGAGAERISLRIAREACRSLQVRSPLRGFAWASASVVAALAAGLILMEMVPWRSMVHPSPVAVVEPGAARVPAPTPVAATAPAPAVVPDAARHSIETPPAQSAAPLAAANVSVAANAIGAPAAEDLSEDVPKPDPPAPEVHAAAPPPRQARAHEAVWRWYVRKGDSLYKVCRRAYGFCDEDTLRAIYSYNPKLDPKLDPAGTIRQGQMLVMPQRIDSAGTN
jgi:general secretion pathway protein A